MGQEHDDYRERYWPPFWVLEFVAVLLIAIAVAVGAYLYLSNQPATPPRQPVIIGDG